MAWAVVALPIHLLPRQPIMLFVHAHGQLRLDSVHICFHTHITQDFGHLRRVHHCACNDGTVMV